MVIHFLDALHTQPKYALTTYLSSQYKFNFNGGRPILRARTRRQMRRSYSQRKSPFRWCFALDYANFGAPSTL